MSSFEIAIKGNSSLPVATTNDPATHGDRLAAQQEFDVSVRDIVQKAVDDIAKLEGAGSVNANGAVGELGPISVQGSSEPSKMTRLTRHEEETIGASADKSIPNESPLPEGSRAREVEQRGDKPAKGRDDDDKAKAKARAESDADARTTELRSGDRSPADKARSGAETPTSGKNTPLEPEPKSTPAPGHP